MFDRRVDVFREHAPERVHERHALAGERTNAGENALAGVENAEDHQRSSMFARRTAITSCTRSIARTLVVKLFARTLKMSMRPFAVVT